MRAVLAVVVLAGLVLVSAPGQQGLPSPYIVRLTPTIFSMKLPANGANPESQCFLWVRLGTPPYDSEVACYVAGVYTGRLDTAPAGAGFGGGFEAPGGGFIRWEVCNTATKPGCGSLLPMPAGLTNPMYYTLGAGLGDGSPGQIANGYY